MMTPVTIAFLMAGVLGLIGIVLVLIGACLIAGSVVL